MMKRIFCCSLVLLAAGCTTPRQPGDILSGPYQHTPVTNVVQSTPPVTPQPVPEPVEVEVTPAPVEPVVPMRLAVAVQSLLDRRNLSPGVIRANWSDQAAHALSTWQAREGLPSTGLPDDSTLARIGDVASGFATYAVTAEDHASVTKNPTSWREKARVAKLGYESVEELVAEKYHCTVELLRELNPSADWPNPPVATLLEVPNPFPSRKPGLSRIEISLGNRLLRGFDDKGNIIVEFPCSIARDVEKRPSGELKIANAASNPVYYFDPDIFPEDEEARTISGKLAIAPGPNNPVGIEWLGLNKEGYGIHGSPAPEEIGITESHGCFRLANWNVAKLAKMVQIGTPVVVQE